jgi:hypothetical protein
MARTEHVRRTEREFTTTIDLPPHPLNAAMNADTPHVWCRQRRRCGRREPPHHGTDWSSLLLSLNASPPRGRSAGRNIPTGRYCTCSGGATSTLLFSQPAIDGRSRVSKEPSAPVSSGLDVGRPTVQVSNQLVHADRPVRSGEEEPWRRGRSGGTPGRLVAELINLDSRVTQQRGAVAAPIASIRRQVPDPRRAPQPGRRLGHRWPAADASIGTAVLAALTCQQTRPLQNQSSARKGE